MIPELNNIFRFFFFNRLSSNQNYLGQRNIEHGEMILDKFFLNDVCLTAVTSKNNNNNNISSILDDIWQPCLLCLFHTVTLNPDQLIIELTYIIINCSMSSYCKNKFSYVLSYFLVLINIKSQDMDCSKLNQKTISFRNWNRQHDVKNAIHEPFSSMHHIFITMFYSAEFLKTNQWKWTFWFFGVSIFMHCCIICLHNNYLIARKYRIASMF